jgi:hypothetical protein
MRIRLLISDEIGIHQSAIEWLTRPGSQKLGAKWVEVTVECEAGRTSQRRI